MFPGFLGGLFGRNRREGASGKAAPGTSHEHECLDPREVSLRCAAAREEERRRMAVDLHDGPIQQLVNLVLRLEMAEKTLPPEAEQTRGELAALRQFARGVLQDMRRFMFELRPASLDEFSLLPVLRQYIQDFRAQYNVPVNLELQDTDWKLGRDIEINLFRIIQEALTNVRKHAKASKVDLALKREGSSVIAEVVDNGRGFDVSGTRARAQQDRKLGLSSMDDRARALGGAVSIESSARGTSVRIAIPVGEEQRAT